MYKKERISRQDLLFVLYKVTNNQAKQITLTKLCKSFLYSQLWPLLVYSSFPRSIWSQQPTWIKKRHIFQRQNYTREVDIIQFIPLVIMYLEVHHHHHHHLLHLLCQLYRCYRHYHHFLL